LPFCSLAKPVNVPGKIVKPARMIHPKKEARMLWRRGIVSRDRSMFMWRVWKLLLLGCRMKDGSGFSTRVLECDGGLDGSTMPGRDVGNGFGAGIFDAPAGSLP
jgi:hypothetical protein